MGLVPQGDKLVGALADVLGVAPLAAVVVVDVPDDERVDAHLDLDGAVLLADRAVVCAVGHLHDTPGFEGLLRGAVEGGQHRQHRAHALVGAFGDLLDELVTAERGGRFQARTELRVGLDLLRHCLSPLVGFGFVRTVGSVQAVIPACQPPWGWRVCGWSSKSLLSLVENLAACRPARRDDNRGKVGCGALDCWFGCMVLQ